jgi:hypothetical protein
LFVPARAHNETNEELFSSAKQVRITKKGKWQNWLLACEGERKIEIAPQKKRNRRARKQEKMRGTKNTRASQVFSSRGELHDEPIDANVRAIARSHHHLKGGVSFFLFYFKNARARLFFFFLSLFLRGGKWREEM